MIPSASHEERRLRQVIEATPVALVMLDAEGRVALVNSETERLFGCQRTELLGRPADDLVPEGFRPGPHR